MKLARVPLFVSPRKSITVNPEATDGAVVGVNLRFKDGTLVDSSFFSSRPAAGSAPASVGKTTDDVQEGRFNLYFTAARASAAAPIQSIVKGSGIAIDTTDPKNPVVSATVGSATGHYDGGNAASVYTLAQHTFDGGGANG